MDSKLIDQNLRELKEQVGKFATTSYILRNILAQYYNQHNHDKECKCPQCQWLHEWAEEAEVPIRRLVRKNSSEDIRDLHKSMDALAMPAPTGTGNSKNAPPTVLWCYCDYNDLYTEELKLENILPETFNNPGMIKKWMRNANVGEYLLIDDAKDVVVKIS